MLFEMETNEKISKELRNVGEMTTSARPGILSFPLPLSENIQVAPGFSFSHVLTNQL